VTLDARDLSGAPGGAPHDCSAGPELSPLPLSADGDTGATDMVRRRLKVFGRYYKTRAETTRFGNPWRHSEIRLGGLYLKALGVGVGDQLTVTVVGPKNISLTKRRKKAVGGRAVTIGHRTSGHTQVKLAGLWLSEAGFYPGDDVDVIATESEIRLVAITSPENLALAGDPSQILARKPEPKATPRPRAGLRLKDLQRKRR
jgi:hypothetical protein